MKVRNEPGKRPAPVVYGVHPLWEAIRDNPDDVLSIHVTPGRTGARIQQIREAAERFSIPVVEADRLGLNALAGTENHQGIVGVVRPFAYADLSELLPDAPGSPPGSLLVALDGIADPQNLGAIIRSAHCFGATGVIVPQDRSATVTATVAKTSAGAVRHLPVARVTNLARTLDFLKGRGFWVYGAEAETGRDVRAVAFADKVALVMGGEGRGLRELVRKKCDFFLTIPMIGNIGSLNVSVAAGIIMAEIFRARRERGKTGRDL
ncbi:MAG: 23S rRNA (guanosine(2251)-2'-O)-methyltransferase RlmB [Pseudomonadota bacterium]|nr:23S rRNA (guanosine(2251)-2'-O)-methyltransferase RlmB [Pseudomonadota bacterium]